MLSMSLDQAKLFKQLLFMYLFQHLPILFEVLKVFIDPHYFILVVQVFYTCFSLNFSMDYFQ